MSEQLTAYMGTLRSKVKASDLFSAPHRLLEQSLNGRLCYYDSAENVVYISQECLNKGEDFHYLVTQAFLEAYWDRMTPRSRLTWQYKLVTPRARTVEQIEHHINSGVPLRVVYQKFTDAVSRLVAIHITNALVKSGGYSHGVPLREHPGTADFVEGTRPFSLVPLLSVYGGYGMDDFKLAAGCWLFGGVQVTESSTKQALEGLLASMFN